MPRQESFEGRNHLDLVYRARQGDELALSKLVQLHRPQLNYLSRLFPSHPFDRDEKYALGLLALTVAVKLHDPRKVEKSKSIFGLLLKAIGKCRLISAQPHRARIKSLFSIYSAFSHLLQELDRPPTLDEVSDHVHKQPRLVRQILLTNPDYLKKPGSLEATMENNTGVPKMVSVQPPGRAKVELSPDELEAASQHLSARLSSSLQTQVTLLRAHGFKPKEIAEILGVSPKSVDNATQKARRKLGVPSKGQAPYKLVSPDLVKKALKTWWFSQEEKDRMHTHLLSGQSLTPNQIVQANKLAQLIQDHAGRPAPKMYAKALKMQKEKPTEPRENS